MKFKLLSIFFILQLFLIFSTHAVEKPTISRKIIVSIAPYKYFVQKIAGDTVEVSLMIPTGANPHFFEPTVKQIIFASQADAWFQIGEIFEIKAKSAILAHNSKIEIIDLRTGIDPIYESPNSSCRHVHCQDPHIWLSPREAKKQAKIIAKVLSTIYPEHAKTSRDSLTKFIEELDLLDREIVKMISIMRNRTILLSHPAFAYFCRDYNLNQLSIEFEGKEPSLKSVNIVIDQAKAAGVKTVFIQKQHYSKGAKVVANKLELKIVEIDPLAENYIDNLLEITRKFSTE